MSNTEFNYTVEGPVLVTGATGYVAGWIVKRLLEAGVTVHAAVRDPSNHDKLRHLEELKNSTSGDLKFFKADLLKEGSYAESMAGCKVVFHTASPFTSKITDPQKDLVDPAKLGTKNVLETANKTESVSRVVLTSSIVAIYGDNKDLVSLPNNTITEDQWNTSSSLTHNPYPYSKTMAEKEAWDIYEKQNRWNLVVLNPSLVFGPGLNSNATSESFSIMKWFGNGLMKRGVPDIALGVVDVRDLADAHLKAAFVQNAHGRYIVSAHNTSLLGIGKALSPEYDSYPIPKSKAPNFLIWLIGPLVDKSLTRRYILANVSYKWKADNSKGINELHLQYRPLKETVCDFFQLVIDAKQI
mmetsp:Transcript_8025/g.7966  ORF Transcript_8025/g.7966 Transcript_8025/m.7966 type:complete len:355 (+) Transcript_8025:150-1214(+)